MRERFCGNCGANLIEEGVCEIEPVISSCSLYLANGYREYDTNVEYHEGTGDMSYECLSCYNPLNSEQEEDIRNLPGEM